MPEIENLIIKNYQECHSTKAMFIFPEDIKNIIHNCSYLVFDENKLYTYNMPEIITLNYSDLEKVTISFCSRIMNFGKIESNPLAIFTENYWQSEEPILITQRMGTIMTYCLDLEIKDKDNNVYSFESFSIINAAKILSLLKKNDVCIDDPIGIIDILKNNPDRASLSKFFQYHFQALAKQHNLDNPRGQVLLTSR